MYFIINKDGYYVEDSLIKTDKCVEIRPPQPCYKPRWNGEEWIEEGQPVEPVPQPPTTEDRLQAIEDTLLFITLGGM